MEANYSLIPIADMTPYACGDVHATRDLGKALNAISMKPRIKNQDNPAWSQLELMRHEMKAMKVLFEMEWTGVKMDRERCVKLRDQAQDEMDMYAEKLSRLSGYSFDPMKRGTVEEAFEKAGGTVRYWSLPKEKKGKQKLDQFTTDKEQSTGNACWNSMAIYKYIEEYKERKNEKALEWVVSYREFTQRQRLVATNLDAYLKGIDGYRRLHGQFMQHRVQTGRLSSVKPNLQNVCKPKGTLDQKLLEKLLGEKDDEALNRQMRSLFIPGAGNAWVCMDYSQIEYRAAAYFAQDESIISKYRNDPNTDYHEATAEICGITDRDHAKTTNFGILYGMGAGSLASLLMITKEQAKAILDRVFVARPALRNFLQKMSQWAERSGWIQNPYGRVCTVPKQLSYKAVNFLVQGFVGDMMREALVNVYNFIQENKLPVKMMLTVHDELDFEMPIREVPHLAPLIVRVMCGSTMMPSVPILAETKVGPNWGEVKGFGEWAKEIGLAA